MQLLLVRAGRGQGSQPEHVHKYSVPKGGHHCFQLPLQDSASVHDEMMPAATMSSAGVLARSSSSCRMWCTWSSATTSRHCIHRKSMRYTVNAAAAKMANAMPQMDPGAMRSFAAAAILPFREYAVLRVEMTVKLGMV